MTSRGKDPALSGKSGGGKSGKMSVSIDEIANRYVVAHWGVKAGEVDLEKLAQSCHTKVHAWTTQSITDYDEMTNLSQIERFSCRFKDEDNHEEILEWWHNRSMGTGTGTGSTTLVAVDDDDDDEGEEEGDDDYSISDDGGSLALTSSKRARGAENIDGIDMPPELREFIKRMRHSFAMQLQQVIDGKQEQLKMVGQLMSERVLDRRRIESLENKCNAMRSELNTYATRTNTLDSRLAAADADGEAYCIPGADDLKPMTNNQIRSLGRAMQEAFKDPTGEERANMIKLLRFDDLQIEEGVTAAEKRSTYKTFARGQLSLNLWKDVAVNLDLAWRLYTYLVAPRNPSYQVLPKKGTHLPSLKYPHSLRLPHGETPMPIHGDPEGTFSPRPMSVMRSMSSLDSSSSAPNLGGRGSNSRTSNTPGVNSMEISPRVMVGGAAALGASSPSLVQAPVQARYPDAKKPAARQPIKKKKKNTNGVESSEDEEEEDSDSLFNSEEEVEADEEIDPSTLAAVSAAAAKRGKSSSRRARGQARQATEQQAADQKAEEEAWAPGGHSYQSAFGGEYALGATTAEKRRAVTDAIAPARGILPDYSAGI